MDKIKYIRATFNHRLVCKFQPEQDEQGRESDIILTHQKYGKYHIEVKHLESGEIFWSELEVSKAKDYKERYWMVLVRPGYDQDKQNIIWFWNPLHDFKDLDIGGRWIWRTEKHAQDTKIIDWQPPKPRWKIDATNFTFVIKTNQGFLDQSKFDPSRGLNCLKNKLNL